MSRTTPSSTRDIIVVAASAGGVEALCGLVSALPVRLQAAVFVVLHMPESGTSHLAHILTRRGNLPAVRAQDGERILPERIYVAVPGLHLALGCGRMRLERGPRENGHRPAADTLFRSAAQAYGKRVAAIVLSGTQDDGAAGLVAVKGHG